MATSGDMQLQLILALTDKISGGLDRPIAKLRSLDTKVAETYKVISNLQRLMGQPVSTGGIDSYLNKVKQLDKVSGASRRIDNFKIMDSCSSPSIRGQKIIGGQLLFASLITVRERQTSILSLVRLSVISVQIARGTTYKRALT